MIGWGKDPDRFGVWLRWYRRISVISPWFGRLLGSIYLNRRFGIIYADQEVRDYVYQSIEPLDIMLARSPFRLTNHIIPGYFHHAGIYLGSREHLATLLGDRGHMVESYCPQGTSTGCVIEATREGVRLVSLDEFLNTDTLAVLRDMSLASGHRDSLVRRAIDELGKKYDFSFGIADDERQFCTKLVATIFSHLHFYSGEVRKSTLIPDYIVKIALSERGFPLKPVLLSDGEGTIIKESLERILLHRIDMSAAKPVKAQA